MNDLLLAVRDRLRSLQGDPSTSPALSTRSVQVALEGEKPVTPVYPHVLVLAEPRTPTRYASALRQTTAVIVVEIYHRLNTREGKVLGNEAVSRARPLRGPHGVADEVIAALDAWYAVDADGAALGWDVGAEWIGAEEVTPVDPETAGATRTRLTFEFSRFDTLAVT